MRKSVNKALAGVYALYSAYILVATAVSLTEGYAVLRLIYTVSCVGLATACLWGVIKNRISEGLKRVLLIWFFVNSLFSVIYVENSSNAFFLLKSVCGSQVYGIYGIANIGYLADLIITFAVYIFAAVWVLNINGRYSHLRAGAWLCIMSFGGSFAIRMSQMFTSYDVSTAERILSSLWISVVYIALFIMLSVLSCVKNKPVSIVSNILIIVFSILQMYSLVISAISMFSFYAGYAFSEIPIYNLVTAQHLFLIGGVFVIIGAVKNITEACKPAKAVSAEIS